MKRLLLADLSGFFFTMAKRRDAPYLPLYVQDFLTDEKLIECSAQSTGVYIRLMCIMHKQEQYGTILLKQKYKQTPKQILNFATQLATSMPYSEGVISAALQELLEEKVLNLEGDLLVQKRMVRDFEISETRAAVGKKGGKVRSKNFAKAKPQAKGQAKPQANAENENEIDIDNDIDNKSETVKKGVQGETTLNIDFDTFWNAYDKKVGEKTKIEKKWMSLHDADRSAIMAYLPRYIQSTPDKKYRKNPETFLNNKSWNDEIVEPAGRTFNNPMSEQITVDKYRKFNEQRTAKVG